MSDINDPWDFDSDDALILKDLAAVGCGIAASDLAVGYEAGQFNDKFEPEPLEELRWWLIEEYLKGNRDWVEYAARFLSIEESDRNTILGEVRSWIKKHPVARQTAIIALVQKALCRDRRQC